MILPPGTILQQMYFKERLRNLASGSFVEVGVGHGLLSGILLDLGWTGCGYDISSQSVAVAAEINRAAIAAGNYRLIERDWLQSEAGETVDLVVSCMVLEHLHDADERRYFECCRQWLKRSGVGILLVPACPDYWSIEDKIAGHYRRYTFDGLRRHIEESGLTTRHIAGLTYPVSNLLHPLSEYLVHRVERNKLHLPMQAKTRLSGDRKVPFKTTFPPMLKIVLNEKVMYPFHLLQKLSARNAKSMVVYAEFSAS